MWRIALQVIKFLETRILNFMDREQRQFDFNLLRDACVKSGQGQLAAEPFFAALVNLIARMEPGGRWLQELLEFHSCLVNSKDRAASLKTLSTFHQMDASRPLVRNCLIKTLYGEKSKDSKVIQGRHLTFIQDNPGIANEMERLLKRFHDEYKALGVYKKWEGHEVTKFLGRLDIHLGKCVLGCKPEDAMRDLLKTAAAQDQALRKKLAVAQDTDALAAMPEALRMQATLAVASVKEQQKAAQKALVPSAAQYDAAGVLLRDARTIVTKDPPLHCSICLQLRFAVTVCFFLRIFLACSYACASVPACYFQCAKLSSTVT